MKKLNNLLKRQGRKISVEQTTQEESKAILKAAQKKTKEAVNRQRLVSEDNTFKKPQKWNNCEEEEYIDFSQLMEEEEEKRKVDLERKKKEDEEFVKRAFEEDLRKQEEKMLQEAIKASLADQQSEGSKEGTGVFGA